MAAPIPDAIRPRLGQFVRLLASDQPGEVVAAAAALRRALAGVGADLNDLGDAIERPAVILRNAPRPSPQPRRSRRERTGDVDLDFAQRRSVVEALRRGLGGNSMNGWEREFAASIVARLQTGRGWMTEKQGETLGRLLGKLGEGKAWA